MDGVLPVARGEAAEGTGGVVACGDFLLRGRGDADERTGVCAVRATAEVVGAVVAGLEPALNATFRDYAGGKGTLQGAVSGLVVGL